MATTSWLAEAADAVTQATSAADLQQQIDGLIDSKAVLAEQLVEFRLFLTVDQLGRSLWWQGVSPTPDLFESLTQAKSLKPRALASLANRIGSHRAHFRAALAAAWDEYASQRMGNVSDLQQLVELLHQVDGLAEMARELQSVLRDLRNLRDALPTAASVELLDQADAQLQRLEAALRPEAVRRFLSAVAHGGAGLELLDADVADWLAQHSAGGKFRIVAGAPSDDSA